MIARFEFIALGALVGLVACGGGDGGPGSTPDAGDPPACEAGSSAHCYYASPAGDGDCSLERPCRLPDAFARLDAGDFLYLRAGTYPLAQSLTTPRGGVDGSPITVRGYGAEGALVTSDGLGSVVYVEHPYWSFRDLGFEARNVPDHDRAILSVGENGDADHVTIHGCRFDLVSAAGHDNVSAIRLQASRSDDARIEGNDVQGFVDGVYGANGVQYLGGGNVGTKILRNVFHDIALAVYVKHTNADTAATGAEIAFNTMRSCHSAFYGNPTYIHFHDNLLIDADIVLGDNGGGAQGSHDRFEHNTLVGSRVELQNPSEGPIVQCEFVANVFTDQVALSPYASGNTTPHESTLDYNLYVPGGSAVLELSTDYSLATWQAHHGQDAHSLAGAPTFVGGGGGSTPQDFALASGSPGHGAAADGSDLGADVALVAGP